MADRERECVIQLRREMCAFIEDKLQEAGIAKKSHSFSDFYRACKLVVTPISLQMGGRSRSVQMTWRLNAVESVIEYVDPKE